MSKTHMSYDQLLWFAAVVGSTGKLCKCGSNMLRRFPWHYRCERGHYARWPYRQRRGA